MALRPSRREPSETFVSLYADCVRRVISNGSRTYVVQKVTGMGYVVAAAAGAVLGFLIGLLSFRIKARWCACGLVKTCPECSGRSFVQIQRHDEHRAANPRKSRNQRYPSAGAA